MTSFDEIIVHFTSGNFSPRVTSILPARVTLFLHEWIVRKMSEKFTCIWRVTYISRENRGNVVGIMWEYSGNIVGIMWEYGGKIVGNWEHCGSSVSARSQLRVVRKCSASAMNKMYWKWLKKLVHFRSNLVMVQICAAKFNWFCTST